MTLTLNRKPVDIEKYKETIFNLLKSRQGGTFRSMRPFLPGMAERPIYKALAILVVEEKIVFVQLSGGRGKRYYVKGTEPKNCKISNTRKRVI